MNRLLKNPVVRNMGIRTKLIALFVVIKVVPLLLLAIVAWQGVRSLGTDVSEHTGTLTDVVRSTVDEMSSRFSSEAEKALDRRAQEELERLTTDTARSVADFLYERDGDILQAARLEPNAQMYQLFVSGRTRKVVPPGKWKLAEDQKSWVQVSSDTPTDQSTVVSQNPENQQDFHYRLPEGIQKTETHPLYHEITFVGLDGQEKIKVSSTDVLPKDLRDVSRKENTWAKAETYFPQLKKLKPGEIYVSEVIGPYVGTHVIGPYTPEKAANLNRPFEPEKEAYAGRENPNGKRFQGIVRWATPVVRNGAIQGYVTLALDHSHIMAFTDHLMPSHERYTRIADASRGNYAFIWDYKDRNIAHPRHHSIVGFDPKTGEYATPWLENGVYEAWQSSGKSLKSFLADYPVFDHQTREKKPAKALLQSGNVGLDCRYINFAPQCQGWHELTEKGGSGSFLILWTGVWKLTTAAAIPYKTGLYGQTPRGFGYVTIGANIDEYHKPAQDTARSMGEKVAEFGRDMQSRKEAFQQMISTSLATTAGSLAVSTMMMIGLMVIIAIWLASKFTHHINEIRSGLERIEKGDFGFRFTKRSEDEVGQLTDALNTMADGVQESFARIEQAKHEAEAASNMKTDFLARMSHELRTPLNGIMGFAELMKEGCEPEEARENAAIIYENGSQLLSMVNDILDLSKLEGGYMRLSPQNTDIRSLIQNISEEHTLQIARKGLRLVVDVSPALRAPVMVDPTRLSQTIDKLFDNAIKFTGTGQVGIRADMDGEDLLIEVTDTGPGIPADKRETLFTSMSQGDRFEERQYTGAGLGLALVRENVRLMGGRVQLLAQDGTGSTFQLTIPI